MKTGRVVSSVGAMISSGKLTSLTPPPPADVSKVSWTKVHAVPSPEEVELRTTCFVSGGTEVGKVPRKVS